MRTPFYDAIRKEPGEGRLMCIALHYPPIQGVCCMQMDPTRPYVKQEHKYVMFQVPIAAADGSVGDLFTSGPSQNRAFAGVGEYIPAMDPPQGDCFLGIDRTIDPIRLAGVRVNGAGRGAREAIMRGLEYGYLEGGSIDTVYLPGHWGPKECDFKVYGPSGQVDVKFDDTLHGGDAFALQTDTWSVYGEDGKLALACEAPGYNVRIVGMTYGG